MNTRLIISIAEAVSGLLDELGYPCYVASNAEWMASTIDGMGGNIRAYVNFSVAIRQLPFSSVRWRDGDLLISRPVQSY